jgi:hypothetical protein
MNLRQPHPSRLQWDLPRDSPDDYDRSEKLGGFAPQAPRSPKKVPFEFPWTIVNFVEKAAHGHSRNVLSFQVHNPDHPLRINNALTYECPNPIGLTFLRLIRSRDRWESFYFCANHGRFASERPYKLFKEKLQ